jgi:hypothetical protein
MKHVIGVILLLGAPLLAQDRKFDGYVMNAAAFKKIQSYCIDTHNLPADQTKVIDRFVAQESRNKGLLTKLPWQRRPTCDAAGLDAVVRLEFPRDPVTTVVVRDEVESGLLVFQPGSPSPIYETPPVVVPGTHRRSREDEYSGKLVGQVLEYSALSDAVRILVHDWRKF